MNLCKWRAKNPIIDTMHWKDRANQQFDFIHYAIRELVSGKQDDPISVISTHTSKSILLPVYHIDRSDIGVEMVMRDNFHDWKLSVKISKEIDINFNELFKGDDICLVYFEGFPKRWIYKGYNSDDKNYSVEIASDYKLYTVIFLLLRFLKKDMSV